MAVPTLTPVSQTSAIALPATADPDEVKNGILPIGIYSNSVLTSFSSHFCTGASDQVSYTYKKLGGDVLDIELTTGSVFSSYEEAVLEYSYIVNIHQAKNTLSDMLGATTGSFDSKGSLTGSNLSSYTGSNGIALKFPRFEFQYARRVGYGVSTEAGIGGETTIYSASFTGSSGDQDFDLQQIVSASADNGTFGSTNPVGNKRIKVRQVYYVSPRQMWRFYGYYGGLNVTGDMHNYGQYSDDSTFEVIPAWQNKAQAISYEDHLYTRTSHYSYELINNNLRLFPIPSTVSPAHIWFRFTIENNDAYATGSYDHGLDGVNNVNSLPFTNLPFQNINSMGQQWIRKFSLSLSKETLGQIRGKFGNSIPIPGDNVSLNASDLLSQAASEQAALKEELNKQLDEMLYSKLAETDKAMADNVNSILTQTPMKIFVG